MASNEDYFKREEDRKWREKVDDRLASLTTGMLTSQDRLEKMEAELDRLDRVLRGDEEEDRAGMLERLHDQETKISRLWAVVFQDAAGERGMYEYFKTMRRGETRWELHWKFLTAVVVAVISMLGLLLKMWPDLIKLWNKPSADQVGKLIEKAKHPKDRYHHYTIRQPADDNAPASDD